MRILKNIFFFFLCTLVSCEVINEADRLIPVFPVEKGGRRHVLLEFTGFRCVNCPAAAQEAQNLRFIYGERLILISLHPASNPFTQGLYDYTCPEADSIYRFMGGTDKTPFPTGNIDLAPTEEGYFSQPSDWAKMVNKAMTDTVSVLLLDTKVSYWLVEDSVLGVQAMPDGSVNTNYYHRHLLRAISQTPITSIPESYDAAHCTVVTIYTDPNDNHILNAYETPFDSIAHSQP